MKKLLTILFIFWTGFVHATNYYVDNGAGGSNSGTISNPWTSLASVNWGSLSSGDTLFISRRTYNEKMTIGRSGSSGNPIIITGYNGADPQTAQPTLSGFTSVGSWTNISGNIWESSSAIKSSTAMLGIVTSNESALTRGRYPKATDANSGYLTFQSHSGEGTGAVITSNAISGASSFVNGEIVIRKNHWILERYGVSGQTSTTVTLGAWVTPVWGASDVYNLQNNWGFFFQNDADACTVQGEWYYNTSTRKLGMYSTSNPSSLNIKASALDTLIDCDGYSYLKFVGITISGANQLGINIQSSTGITLDGCTISYIGRDGVYGYSNNITVTNCTFDRINNNGLYINSGTGATITNSTFKYIYNIAGEGQNSDQQGHALSYIGANSTIQGNTILGMGYHGIRFHGGNVLVKNNYIKDVCTVKDDGAAIYGGALDFSGCVIEGNVVINSQGAPDGTDGANYGEGIYIDDQGENAIIRNNTVADCGNAGLFTNAGINLTYRENTVYNCKMQFGTDNWSGTPTGLSLKKNIFVARTSTQYSLLGNSNISSSFTSTDSNYYARPVDDDYVFKAIGTEYTMSGWRSYSGQDAHSLGSPKSVTSTDSLLFVYNPTDHDSVVSLPYKYIDVYNNTYDGSITLGEYSGTPLMYIAAKTEAPQGTNEFKFKKGRIKFGGSAYKEFFIPDYPQRLILPPYSSKVLIYKSKASGDVLPVSLINFNTSRSGNVVTINWSTASESNNSHFEIQTSEDGINWKTVQSVPSKTKDGNSNSKLDYSTQIILK